MKDVQRLLGFDLIQEDVDCHEGATAAASGTKTGRETSIWIKRNYSYSREHTSTVSGSSSPLSRYAIFLNITPGPPITKRTV